VRPAPARAAVAALADTRIEEESAGRPGDGPSGPPGDRRAEGVATTAENPDGANRGVRYKNTTAEPPDTRARSADHVQSLERGLSVIRAFDAEHRELGLSEVARKTGLTRAAARRFLLTLVELGYMRFDAGRFSLRPRVLELGFSYLSSLSLPEVAHPHMEALVATINESSSISVLDDTDVVYVARVPTRRIMSITLAVGARLPAYATSMGRVLLAALPDDELDERLARIEVRPLTPRTVKSRDELRGVVAQVRKQGHAVVDQELEQGLRSAAVPLHDASGAVVAALNVSVHASRATMPELRARFLPPAKEAAAAIDAELRKSGLRISRAAALGRG
jgi:IclR family pca regulon transcriptional regulator